MLIWISPLINSSTTLFDIKTTIKMIQTLDLYDSSELHSLTNGESELCKINLHCSHAIHNRSKQAEASMRAARLSEHTVIACKVWAQSVTPLRQPRFALVRFTIRMVLKNGIHILEDVPNWSHDDFPISPMLSSIYHRRATFSTS